MSSICYLWFSKNTTAPDILLPVQKAVFPHLQIPGRPLQRPGLHGLQSAAARDLQPLEPLQPLEVSSAEDGEGVATKVEGLEAGGVPAMGNVS